MNTEGAADSSAGAYTYVHLYTYIMLYYNVNVYYVCISVKDASARTTK